LRAFFISEIRKL